MWEREDDKDGVREKWTWVGAWEGSVDPWRVAELGWPFRKSRVAATSRIWC